MLVLDPSETRWDADFVTKDVDEYMQVVFSNNRCLMIVDEAGEAIGRALSDATRNRVTLATRSRHQGHSAIFIAQRPALLAPAIRTQCERAWIFRQHYNELKTLAVELCNDGIMAASSLGRGKCLYSTLYGEIREINVFALDSQTQMCAK